MIIKSTCRRNRLNFQNYGILYCLKVQYIFYLLHTGNLVTVTLVEILLVTFIAAKEFCQHSFLEEIPVHRWYLGGQRVMKSSLARLTVGTKHPWRRAMTDGGNSQKPGRVVLRVFWQVSSSECWEYLLYKKTQATTFSRLCILWPFWEMTACFLGHHENKIQKLNYWIQIVGSVIVGVSASGKLMGDEKH